MARMHSAALGFDDPERCVPTAELVVGEERDMAVAVGVTIEDARVDSWKTQRLSDHERLDFVTSKGDMFSTLNINGTTMPVGDKAGHDLNACAIPKELLKAFRTVLSTSAERLFAPLFENEVLSESRFRTALRFWSGPNVADLNKKARAFSPFLQGKNDLHPLLVSLVGMIKRGVRPEIAAFEIAGCVDLEGVNWSSTHDLPRDYSTQKRLAIDNKEQQRTNLVFFFFYMATVAEMCPSAFCDALATAPVRPTAVDITAYIDDILSQNEVTVFALQEVPPAIVSSLSSVCERRGYTMHAAPSLRSPCVATIVKNGAVGRLGAYIHYNSPLSENAHRALATQVVLSDGTVAMVLNLHGDEHITRAKTSQFEKACADNFRVAARVVLGDLQVGKIPGKHARVFRDMAQDLGVEENELTCTPPLITRQFEDSPNVFCCQFKFKNVW